MPKVDPNGEVANPIRAKLAGDISRPFQVVPSAPEPAMVVKELTASVGPSSKLAKPKKVPILIDAAAEVLTIPNVHLQKGADIVAYSGGKAICGPQCAGLLLGKKDLVVVFEKYF